MFNNVLISDNFDNFILFFIFITIITKFFTKIITLFLKNKIIIY